MMKASRYNKSRTDRHITHTDGVWTMGDTLTSNPRTAYSIKLSHKIFTAANSSAFFSDFPELSGAGYVTWVGVDSTHFTLKKGDHHLNWYFSSPGARRGFCSSCGSTMLFESERWAGETHVSLACLDGPIDRKPRANAFFDTHVGWMPIDDGLEEIPG